MATEKFKVWYNSEKQWYEVFTPEGIYVPCITETQVSSSFNKPPELILTCYVDIVTDRPEPNLNINCTVKGSDLLIIMNRANDKLNRNG